MFNNIDNKKISRNNLLKIKISDNFIKEWKKSFFVISYNFHNIENRDLYFLKKNLKDYSFIKVFKNSIIRKSLKELIHQEKNDSYFKNSNLIIFGKNNYKTSFFKVLELIKKFEKENLSNDEINNFNWAFFDNKFEYSELINEWSKLPNIEDLIKKLINSLSYNLIIFIECIKKINMNKENNNNMNNLEDKGIKMEELVDIILSLNPIEMKKLTDEIMKKTNIDNLFISNQSSSKDEKENVDEKVSSIVSLVLSQLPKENSVPFYLSMKNMINNESELNNNGKKFTILEIKKMATDSLENSKPFLSKISIEASNRILKEAEKFNAIFKRD